MPEFDEISSIQSKSKINSRKSQIAPEKEDVERMLSKPLNLSSEELMDHAMAFDQFRRAYRKY